MPQHLEAALAALRLGKDMVNLDLWEAANQILLRELNPYCPEPEEVK